MYKTQNSGGLLKQHAITRAQLHKVVLGRLTVIVQTFLLAVDGLFYRVLDSLQERSNSPSSCLDGVVRRSPVLCAASPDSTDAVQSAQIELLGHPDAHIV